MSNSSDVTSSITDAQRHFGVFFARYCTIPGTCVCFLVLVVCSFAAYYPRPRQHMNRVSFRLLIYSLISHVLFGIAYAASPNTPQTGARCALAAFCGSFFASFSTFFTTCIAINLQLVVVHHINGQRMEKYYLIGSTLLCLALNVPALALGQFGWNETSSVCWYKNADRTIRLHWILATQSCPLMLASTIETVCSCILLVYMYLVQRSTEAFFMPFILSSIRSVTRATDSNNAERQRRSLNNIVQHPRYRKAILRIVLYPIVSLVINFITVALDLNSTLRDVDTQLQFRLLILDLTLVGMRTLPYGVLAAFDPALTNAVLELLGKNKSRTGEVSTKPPIEFAENRQLPGTTSGAETQSGSNMETTSLGERMLNVVGENVNGDGERGVGIEKMGKLEDLEECTEFPMIERHI